MSETARVLVFTEGPFADSWWGRFGWASRESYKVGQFKVVRREDGVRLGAYRVEAVAFGIARTKWFDEEAFEAECQRIGEVKDR